ncbi:EamA family transporter RarD [Microbacterium pumilum]|uniref:EamA family transporter RarD n=1 Tax=Microbacterium pumilum TaxID=344165 RepID=A0ABP5DNV8_9MICO
MTRDASETADSTTGPMPVTGEAVPTAPRHASAALTGDPRRERALGGVYAFSAYLIWGFLPLYFLLLAPTGPWELVAWRIVLSLAFCVVLLAITRGWRRLGGIMQQRRLLALTALSGVLIYINWQVFILATLTGHVIETSLGYFINPIVTVLLGVVVLRERLRITQWVAIALAALAVGVIIIGYGEFPWIALTLAASFGLYGLVKNRIGPAVDAVSGLTLESLWLMPVASALLIVVGATAGLSMGANGGAHAVLLSLAGVVTATPLLFFAAGARRVPLTVIGLLQFLTPIMQFVIGAWVLHEPMTRERWIGFVLVWIALTVLTIDSLLSARRTRRAELA